MAGKGIPVMNCYCPLHWHQTHGMSCRMLWHKQSFVQSVVSPVQSLNCWWLQHANAAMLDWNLTARHACGFIALAMHVTLVPPTFMWMWVSYWSIGSSCITVFHCINCHLQRGNFNSVCPVCACKSIDATRLTCSSVAVGRHAHSKNAYVKIHSSSWHACIWLQVARTC